MKHKRRTFNEVYCDLSSVLQSKAARPRQVDCEIKMHILREVRKHTVVPLLTLLKVAQTYRPSLRKASELIRHVISALPLNVFTLTKIDTLKLLTKETFVTLATTFPDSTAAPHFIALFDTLTQHSEAMSRKFETDRASAIDLFNEKLKDAHSINNRVAVMYLKQVAEALFGEAVFTNEIHCRNVSNFRASHYSDAKTNLVASDAAFEAALCKYNARTERLQAEVDELRNDDEIDEYEENTSLSMYLRINHLERKLSRLAIKKDEVVHKAMLRRKRIGKKAMLNHANRLKIAKGALPKFTEESQRFCNLALESQDRRVLATVDRSHHTNVVLQKVNVFRDLLLAQNVFTKLVRENPSITPTEALTSWKSMGRDEQRDFIISGSFQGGITSEAIVSVYAQPSNEAQPVGCLHLFGTEKAHKSIKPLSHLNDNVCFKTLEYLQLGFLLDPAVAGNYLTHSDDDTSVQRGDHNTTNNTRNTIFLFLKDENGQRQRLCVKSSSAQKDETHLFTQSSVFEVLWGHVTVDANGDVTSFNRRGGGQCHFAAINPKFLHHGNNAEAKSIAVHFMTRDNGVKVCLCACSSRKSPNL